MMSGNSRAASQTKSWLPQGSSSACCVARSLEFTGSHFLDYVYDYQKSRREGFVDGVRAASGSGQHLDGVSRVAICR